MSNAVRMQITTWQSYGTTLKRIVKTHSHLQWSLSIYVAHNTKWPSPSSSFRLWLAAWSHTENVDFYIRQWEIWISTECSSKSANDDRRNAKDVSLWQLLQNKSSDVALSLQQFQILTGCLVPHWRCSSLDWLKTKWTNSEEYSNLMKRLLYPTLPN